MTKLILVLFFSCSFLLSGFDKTEEQKILSVVESMVTAINEKDAEKYIQTLGDYFIKVRYGDKDFIWKNINNFGHVDLLETKVVPMNIFLV
ncbi:hypothetical protein ACFPA1_09430 [Neobacillus sp. GCM10023253]|uniref:hypothetical protein n=1 Tax=Neobacillus sp. GCM10023253 TaxID=3252644 RepID=UPI003612FF89